MNRYKKVLSFQYYVIVYIMIIYSMSNKRKVKSYDVLRLVYAMHMSLHLKMKMMKTYPEYSLKLNIDVIQEKL